VEVLQNTTRRMNSVVAAGGGKCMWGDSVVREPCSLGPAIHGEVYNVARVKEECAM